MSLVPVVDQVRLRSGTDPESGHFATVLLPFSVAALSPTLSLIFSSGFRESQSGLVDLPSVTPSALREVCNFLRIAHDHYKNSSGNTFTVSSKKFLPRSESVLETLEAARFLDLHRLTELCCKVMAQHFDHLPEFLPSDVLPFELRMQILRRLGPIQLCKAERSDFLQGEECKNTKRYNQLWQRMARKR